MMRVSLLNLGDTPRIFHDRLGKPTAVPVGVCTVADLSSQVVQGLRFPVGPETILVREEHETDIPDDVRPVINLLRTIEFDSQEDILVKFLSVVPPNNLTQIRPSRQQMRMTLHTMVVDWIAAQRDNVQRPFVRDDEDPKQLEREQADAERQRQPPVHPVQKEKDQTRRAAPTPARRRGRG